MIRRITLSLLLAALPALALAQAPVLQGGSQTQGHIPAYATTGGTPVVTDGGTSAGGVLGANPSTIGITARCANPPCIAQGAGPNGEDFAIFDGPTSDPEGYHYLGFSANIGSKATITTGAGGGAAAQGLQFIIDGTTYAFPDDFPTIPVDVDQGGTGRQTLTDYNVLVGAGTNPVALIAPSATSGVPLISQGSSANPAYGTAVVAGGGTGATSFTANGVLYGNGTSAVGVTATGTSGQPLLSAGSGSAPAYGTLGIAAGGTGQTTASAAITALLPTQAGQNGKVLQTDGSLASWQNIAGTGTVTQVNTGAGLTGGPITGTGTIKFEDIADNRLLANVSGGAAPASATTMTSALDEMLGSTQGSILYRNATVWTPLTPGTNGQALITQGPTSDPVWSQYLINNLGISGQAQGDVLYFNGATWTRLPAGTAGYVLTTNGAGVNPSFSPSGVIYLGSETWTDSEANSTTTVYLTRVGNQVFVQGTSLATGVFSGSNFEITIPAGYTPNGTIYVRDNTNGVSVNLGIGNITDYGTAQYQASVRLIEGNNIRIQVLNTSATYATYSAITATVPMTWANDDRIIWSANWIVDGW